MSMKIIFNELESNGRPYFEHCSDDIFDLWHDGGLSLTELANLSLELQYRSRISAEFKVEVVSELAKKINEFCALTEQIDTTEPEPVQKSTKERRSDFVIKYGNFNWREIGLLRASGYSVGRHANVSTADRRHILSELFLRDDLSDVSDRTYAKEWGLPYTKERLTRLKNSLKSFISLAKKNPNNLEDAISSWKSDIKFLKSSFG